MADWDNMNFVPEEFECRHCVNNPNCPGHSKDVMDDESWGEAGVTLFWKSL